MIAWSCHSNPNPKFKNRKINEKKSKKEMLNKKASVQGSQLWHYC